MWITVPHFCGMKFCHFFSVADGHGQHGEKVSGYLKQKLPQHLEAQLKFMLKRYTENLQKTKKEENLNTDEVCIAFNNAFLNCNDELFSGILDIRFSGSTCVTVLTMGQKLFCSNVGDSRGIVVKRRADNSVVAQAIFQIVSAIEYSNFKDSVHGDPDRDVTYMQVWSAMYGFQQGKL